MMISDISIQPNREHLRRGPIQCRRSEMVFSFMARQTRILESFLDFIQDRCRIHQFAGKTSHRL
jgi:hypothetical protein